MKFLIIKIIKCLLLPFGMFYQKIKGEKNEIIILMYHRVDNNIKKELSVKVKNFKRQINYLMKKNYTIISMDDAEKLIQRREISGKYIVLTFDDGYEDFFNVAFPVLRQKRIPSIVYLVPGYIETKKVFPWDEDVGESRLMNWNQIMILSKTGLVYFGSHTQNHYDVDMLNEKELQVELETSKQMIEEKLGYEIKHFAYPRGISNQSSEVTVKKIYHTGVLIFKGEPLTNITRSDSMKRLKRIPVQRSDGFLLFIARMKGWLVMEEVLKNLFSK